MDEARTYKKANSFVSLQPNTKNSLALCSYDLLLNSVLKALISP